MEFSGLPVGMAILCLMPGGTLIMEMWLLLGELGSSHTVGSNHLCKQNNDQLIFLASCPCGVIYNLICL